ncbi:MAG TPA: UDP-N-acetylmuramoyl-L-alanine--D-glutamate ligase [Trebonia sp.]|nr:UDP-N-acetylmuramoyl-L-alanine--D-glutamate ligase [Trebonia sp.]
MTTERPRLSWTDLAGQTVGVWGFGREGNANLRKLRSMGVEPVLVDDNPPNDEVLATGEGGLDALLKCDVVVKTPGISRYRPEADRLRDAGVVLAGGLGLWLQEKLRLQEADRERVVVVTGTKGKSTTSSVIAHLLTGLGHPAAAGGNIGLTPYDPELARQPGYAEPEYWVIEVSSYQATDLAATPPVTAATSLHPDHLPWHGGLERYYRDKLSALAQPGADLTVANGDSAELRERAALLGPRVEWVAEDDEPGATWMEPLGLPGRHNRRNALIAHRVLRGLGLSPSDDDLRRAASGYQPLPSRLREIGVVDGVSFVDDSLSTNVLPTLAALDAFPGRRVALIVGGQDRGIDYGELAEGVGARGEPTVVMTLPDSGRRISATFAATAPGTDVRDCADLRQAAAAGFEWARPDGVVLLSPAAPSFGHFRDYRDRAEAFAQTMRELGDA